MQHFTPHRVRRRVGNVIVAMLGSAAATVLVASPAQSNSAHRAGHVHSAMAGGVIAQTPGLVIPPPRPGTSAGGLSPRSTPISRPSGDDTGNFRVTCMYSHMNFDDAIVFPRRRGATHLHTYFGNGGANATSTGRSLLRSGTSTCDGGILNRSSYWIPSVIDVANPTQPRAIAPVYNMIYYKSGYQGVAPGQIVTDLPLGLSMIAGNAKATSSQGEPAYNRQVNWSCVSGGYLTRSASIPNCAQGDELLAEIQFPQCWDGVRLTSTDQSHMAYGTYGVGCPSTHPVALPSISFNIHWDVPAGGTASWRLSSDMYTGGPGGYSLHGDVMLAWDAATARTWLANCTNANADCNVGQITDTQGLATLVR
jgi:hypothetical protein